MILFLTALKPFQHLNMENNNQTAMKKSLSEIGWNISEPEYRKDPALSQSTLASYERNGFECLDKLFEHIETPSLTFGSAVDCILTDGEVAFTERFFVSDMPKISATAEPIVKEIYEKFHNSYTNIRDIPESELMPILSQAGYKGNTKWGTKAKCDTIKTDGAQYYQTMFMANGKTILSQDVYNKVFACVRALKDSPQTKMYFSDNDPFDDIERVYQMKFKGVLNGITYRGMSDLLVVNHKEKYIIPCDLKTSHNREYNFPRSFAEFRYDIQGRLYWRLIRQLLDTDEYFKDFKLMPFRFIVVNNFDTPVPLVWKFEQCMVKGEIEIGGRKFRDPETIGEEITYYLKETPQVPIGIDMNHPNSIEQWFEKK